MLYTYEFEVFKEEKWFVVIPFDFEGATQGKNEKEAAFMASDWLRMEIEYRLMGNEEIPEATFGNEPQYGGRIMLVSVEASLDTIKAVQAFEAAEILGVTRGRISQMVDENKLHSFKKGRDVYITMDSINVRLKEARRFRWPKKPKAEKQETVPIPE